MIQIGVTGKAYYNILTRELGYACTICITICDERRWRITLSSVKLSNHQRWQDQTIRC